ncbi:MAG: hypothetical protein RIQ71_1760 [Verrucomicrobiota bacterium]|jgi:hypothetical protein
MPDIKAHYERYLLAAAGLAAVAVCIMLSFAAGSAKEAAVSPPEAGKREPFTPAPEVETLKSDFSAMDEKLTLRESTNGASPFVSRIYLLNEGRLVDILESGNDLFKGIPNKWIMDNQLDYLDASLPERDADSDGFTNLEEFTAQTSPRDASSKPEDWTKLRLTEFQNEQLQSIFTGRDDQGRAMINSVAASSDALQGKPIGPTKSYSRGDIIVVAKYRPGFAVTYDEEKTPFKLKDFRIEKRPNPRITNPDGTPQIDEFDIAILQSTSGDDSTVVELEARKPVTSPYSLATLLDTRPDGKSQQVRAGQPFTVGSGRYKLVDVSEEKATIEDLATKQQHSIPRGSATKIEPSSNPSAEQPK